MRCNTRKAVAVIVLLAGAGAVVATVGVGLIIGPEPRAEPLDEYGSVPEFELIDQHRRTVTRDDLLGRVWVAEFIFTRCAAICPIMIHHTKAVRDELASRSGEISFVSISVDPEHDTPEVLRQYARVHDADADNWMFLTAEQREPIWRLSEEGFMLGVSEAPENPYMPINHGSKRVLVDRDARIRGYYSGTTTEGRQELVADIIRLLRE